MPETDDMALPCLTPELLFPSRVSHPIYVDENLLVNLAMTVGKEEESVQQQQQRPFPQTPFLR